MTALPTLKSQAVLPITDFKAIGEGHVRALIVDADGRLLLLHWDKGRFRPGDWAPVQGRVGDEPNPPDETPIEAARREVEEETGYAGDALTWRMLYPNCWLVQLPPGAGPPQLSAEHNAYRWLAPADAQIWLAREQFYGAWTRSLGRRGRVRKQLDAHHPHIAAALVHGAQLGDWDPLAQLIAGSLSEAGSEAAVQAVDALGNDDPGVFRVANRAAIDWATQRAAALVRGIQGRTEAGLRELVATALGEGWSTDELAQAIQDDWLFSPERAELISRTELAMAHSQGTLATWKATGQVAGKRNILSNLHAIDDECDDATAVGVIPIDDVFPDGSAAPPYHPRCLLGATHVTAVGVTAQTARRYHGELIVIGLASQDLAVTPNHPILTARGWIAAGALQFSDLLVQCLNPRVIAALKPDDHYVQAVIEEVADTVWVTQPMTTRKVPVAPVDFHGDGTADEEVHIVWPDSHLRSDWTEPLQFSQDTAFGRRQRWGMLLHAHSAAALLGIGHSSSTNSGVSSGGPPRALGRSLLRGIQPERLTHTADGERQALKPVPNRPAVAADAPSEIHARLSGQITLVQPTYLERRQNWQGQVFNLSTTMGWYCAEGIITHNCECVMVPDFLPAENGG